MPEMELHFEFGAAAKRELCAILLALPEDLRPTTWREDEGEASAPIGPAAAFLDRIEKRKFGLMLHGPAGVFDIGFTGGGPIKCGAYLKCDALAALTTCEQLAAAGPVFGFAAAPEERQARNRIVFERDFGRVEAWVGRDVSKYIPGLYWTTVLSEDFALKHGVDLNALKGAARNVRSIPNGRCLLRFYDDPTSHEASAELGELAAREDGIFQVARVAIEIASARSFLEVQAVLRRWK